MSLITSLPAWAVSDDAKAWFLGFGACMMAVLFRAALNYFRAVGRETYE